jgi:general secretion pathway protein D
MSIGVTGTLRNQVRIKTMRRAAIIFATGFLTATLSLPAFGRDDSALAPPISCRNGLPGGVNCIVSKQDHKDARNAFARGVKLEDHKRLEEAFTQFDEASRLVPQNRQFLTARELVKAQLVFNHVQRGNLLLMENSRTQAATEFRAALDLDPLNPFARERLDEATREPAPRVPRVLPARLTDAAEIRIEPRNDRATFRFSGDVRGLFSELATAFGVTTQFDESMKNRQVLFNVEDVDFFAAVKLACQISKTMWAPLDAHQILIADDTPDNHKTFDHMSLQTFVLPPHSSPQEATEMVNALRTMFDLRFLTSGQTSGSVAIRAPRPILDACGKLLAQLDNERPQVMLDVQILQISHQLTRNIGLNIPTSFNLYNIPAAALAGLGGQSIQDLINQLISSGGINQAGGAGLAGLLAQLGGGQANSIFSQPLTTFGGGLTFMGLSLGQLTANLSVNESWVQSLEHMTVRANQGSDSTFHLGERYPILNASYAPIYNSPQIAQVLGNQTYVPPFPSVSYEDLGLSVKAKPTIHGDGDVSLQLELEVRSLTGQSSDGVPVLSNREYKGSINLKDGEPAVVAGAVSLTDTRSMTGLPGLGFLPILNNVMVSNAKSEDNDELMIVITPHVLANFSRDTPEIWISEK